MTTSASRRNVGSTCIEFATQCGFVHANHFAVPHDDAAVDDHGFDRAATFAIDDLARRAVERDVDRVLGIDDHEVRSHAGPDRSDLVL